LGFYKEDHHGKLKVQDTRRKEGIMNGGFLIVEIKMAEWKIVRSRRCINHN
jgi:hypothetical protein